MTMLPKKRRRRLFSVLAGILLIFVLVVVFHKKELITEEKLERDVPIGMTKSEVDKLLGLPESDAFLSGEEVKRGGEKAFLYLDGSRLSRIDRNRVWIFILYDGNSRVINRGVVQTEKDQRNSLERVWDLLKVF